MEQQRKIRATLSATTLLGLFLGVVVGSYLWTRDLTLSAEILIWSYLLFTASLQIVIAWSFVRNSEVVMEHSDQYVAGKIVTFGIVPVVALGFLYLAWSGSYLMSLGILLLVLQFRESWHDEAQEMKARGLAGAVCLLVFVFLTATGMSGLFLALVTTLSYQATLNLTSRNVIRKRDTLTNF
jgi:hypothetical protein